MFAGSRRDLPVQTKGRGPRRARHDFDLTGPRARDAHSEGLAHGLLGSEARGQPLHGSSADCLLVRREVAIEEGLAACSDHVGEPTDVDGVHADRLCVHPPAHVRVARTDVVTAATVM